MAHISRFPILNVFPFGRGSPPGAAHKTVFPFEFFAGTVGEPVFGLLEPTAYWGFDSRAQRIGDGGYLEYFYENAAGTIFNPLQLFLYEHTLDPPTLPGGVYGGFEYTSIDWSNLHLKDATKLPVPLSSFALSVWMRDDNVDETSSRINQLFYAKQLVGGLATTKVEVNHSESDGTLSCVFDGRGVSAYIPPLEWTHVFLFAHSSGLVLYVNGVFSSSAGPVPFDLEPQWNSVGVSNIRCHIDELAVWCDPGWSMEEAGVVAATLAEGVYLTTSYPTTETYECHWVTGV